MTSAIVRDASDQRTEAPRDHWFSVLARLSPERLARASSVARSLGAAAVLVSDPATVRWLGVPATTGVHVLVRDGAAVLVSPRTAGLDLDEHVETWEAADVQALGHALVRALLRAGLRRGAPIAIEAASLPIGVGRALDRPWVDATRPLAHARMRKCADEIELISRAAALVAVGHASLRAALRPGLTELQLWASAQAAMQEAADRPVQAIVDLMVGDRTALIGSPPTGAPAHPGAPLLFDLAPCLDGYWADSCATMVVGSPTPELRRRYTSVLGALETGLAEARPGRTAGDVDAAIRARLLRDSLTCPHHTGHGVGTAAQEDPWLIPGSRTILEEGMVIAMEPGAYGSGFGVRLEVLALIQSDGARILTAHSLALD